jgi:hypothetical protein
MGDHAFESIVAMMLAVAGLLSIFRRRSMLGLGGGRSGPAGALFTITLTESRVMVFGLESLVGAIIVLVPLLYVYAKNDSVAANNGVLKISVVIGVGVAALGFVSEAFFEFLQKIRDNARQKISQPLSKNNNQPNS